MNRESEEFSQNCSRLADQNSSAANDGLPAGWLKLGLENEFVQ
jgi:hypothetical protein